MKQTPGRGDQLLLIARTEALYLGSCKNPSEIVGGDLCELRQSLQQEQLRNQRLRQMLAGLEETSCPLVEPSVKKSAQRWQRQTQVADKRRAATAQTA